MRNAPDPVKHLRELSPHPPVNPLSTAASSRILLALLVLLPTSPVRADSIKCDLCIYGETSDDQPNVTLIREFEDLDFSPAESLRIDNFLIEAVAATP